MSQGWGGGPPPHPRPLHGDSLERKLLWGSGRRMGGAVCNRQDSQIAAIKDCKGGRQGKGCKGPRSCLQPALGTSRPPKERMQGPDHKNFPVRASGFM